MEQGLDANVVTSSQCRVQTWGDRSGTRAAGGRDVLSSAAGEVQALEMGSVPGEQVLLLSPNPSFLG